MKLSRNPSIWLLGIVEGRNGWFHQILGGDLHEWKTAEPRSVFIDYIAVQEPEHDPFEENDEFCPSLVPGSYKYKAGLEDGSSSRDELAVCGLNEYIGRRRVGVLF
jgi:hypothetical protein